MRHFRGIVITLTVIAAQLSSSNGFARVYRRDAAPAWRIVEQPIRHYHDVLSVRPTITRTRRWPSFLRYTSILHGTISITATFQTSFALLVAAYLGRKTDKALPGSGILMTLCVGAAISHLFGVSSMLHHLNDMIWSNFLPASLVFLLLSLPPPQRQQSPSNSTTRLVIKRLAVPFSIASLGSILGCLCSFGIATRFPSLMNLSHREALLAASCLSASFVGGSVNFLATATALNVQQTSLVGSMAAVDVLVMALYFCCLGSSAQSSRLKNWFTGPPLQKSEPIAAVKTANDLMFIANQVNTMESAATNQQGPLRLGSLSRPLTVTASILAATLIVRLANRVESVLSSILPGTACLVIAAITPIVQQGFGSMASAHDMSRWTTPLFETCFFLVFASMGMSVDLVQVIQQGRACLLFASLALLVHGLVTLISCKIYRQIGDSSVQLIDTLIASNAAIGGATTAAAFSGQAPSDQRKELVVAGTVWGIVGYAIGTTVGVTLYRVLQRFVC